jgi:hypothetical protein
MGLCRCALGSCAVNMHLGGFGGNLRTFLGVFPIIFGELRYILGSTPGHLNVYALEILVSIVLSCCPCPTQPRS